MTTEASPSPKQKTAKQNETSPVMTSESLFGDHETVLIRHNGMIYTLRKTRQGKLILTK